jgi:hypothetical protein
MVVAMMAAALMVEQRDRRSAVLTLDARRVSIAARMSNMPNPRERGPREHRPPMTIEVDHTVVVSLRPEARRRDVPVARLVRDLLDRVGAEPGLVGAIPDYGEPGA